MPQPEKRIWRTCLWPINFELWNLKAERKQHKANRRAIEQELNYTSSLKGICERRFAIIGSKEFEKRTQWIIKQQRIANSASSKWDITIEEESKRWKRV